MLQIKLEAWLFYNGWVFVGILLLALALLSKVVASSSSFTLGKISKVNKSRSRVTTRMLWGSTYLYLILGVACLLYGFRDKFGQSGNTKAPVSRAELTKKFKKCSRFREGYCLCRTADRQSTWVLIRQTDGAQLETIAFPDELAVIGVDVFERGVAPVTGTPHGRKEKVAEVDTLGRVVIFK